MLWQITIFKSTAMEVSNTVLEVKNRASLKKRFVLYADIMGFRARVKSRSHSVLLNEMRDFVTQIKKQSKQFLIGNHLNYAIFSDSIIISTDDATIQRFNLLTKAGARLMHIALNMGIPLKGVIAKGEFTHSQEEGLYVGEALVDSYELHEELKYYGIVVHHSAEDTVKRFVKDDEQRHQYSNTPITLKGARVSHYHLCWNLISEKLCYEDITDKAVGWLDVIAESVSGAPRVYIDNTLEVLKQDRKIMSPSDKSVHSNI